MTTSVGEPSPFTSFPPGDIRWRDRFGIKVGQADPVRGYISIKPALGERNKRAVLIFVFVKVSSAPGATLEPNLTYL